MSDKREEEKCQGCLQEKMVVRKGRREKTKKTFGDGQGRQGRIPEGMSDKEEEKRQGRPREKVGVKRDGRERTKQTFGGCYGHIQGRKERVRSYRWAGKRNHIRSKR